MSDSALHERRDRREVQHFARADARGGGGEPRGGQIGDVRENNPALRDTRVGRDPEPAALLRMIVGILPRARARQTHARVVWEFGKRFCFDEGHVHGRDRSSYRIGKLRVA